MAPPEKWACWASGNFEGPKLEVVYERIRVLREAGLTGQMVAKDVVKRRIAPLQWHLEPRFSTSRSIRGIPVIFIGHL